MAVGSGTTPLGIHYLLPGDAPDLAGITQQAGNDVDGLLTPLRADTGWVTLPLNTSTTPQIVANNRAPQVRVKGNLAWFRGDARQSNSAAFTSTTAWTIVNAGGVPAGARPPEAWALPVISSGAILARLVFGTDGSVILAVPSGNSLQNVQFYGCAYPVD